MQQRTPAGAEPGLPCQASTPGEPSEWYSWVSFDLFMHLKGKTDSCAAVWLLFLPHRLIEK